MISLMLAVVLTLNSTPETDLKSGFAFKTRVKFNANSECRSFSFDKGGYSYLGAYCLRVDPKPEAKRFSFFVNVDGKAEPRVSSSVEVVPEKWYDLEAGWDGEIAYLVVNGKRSQVVRKGKVEAPLLSPIKVSANDGEVEGITFLTPDEPLKDVALDIGLDFGCKVKFSELPMKENMLIAKDGSYMVRFDRYKEGNYGNFNFYINIDGSWEPHVGVGVPVEVGKEYNLQANWNGRELSMSVDGLRKKVRRPIAKPKLNTSHKTMAYKSKKWNIARPFARITQAVGVSIQEIKSASIMPRIGDSDKLMFKLYNDSFKAIKDVTIEASAVSGTVGGKEGGVTLPLGDLAEMSYRDVAMDITCGTNGISTVAVKVKSGNKLLFKRDCTLVFMPKQDPDYSTASGWMPPIQETKAYYVDARNGDDKKDGLSPQTAWKSFANISDKNFKLGSGERLLLKRGSVFREELNFTAEGAPENWSELGAYGKGPRPVIARNRYITDRCVFIDEPKYLAVRDLIVCNAAYGLGVRMQRAKSRGVLVERCLAHHIEGNYRENSHGIPEWRGYGRAVFGLSGGLAVRNGGRDIVFRDCEGYQCSSAWGINGSNVFIHRVYSHDNACHNTSPHPCFTDTIHAWMIDCVFDRSGWNASAGTMGIMLGGNNGLKIKGCHFLNQPDSGSHDEGGVDFEAGGENCIIEECTFENNAGAAIEVLGLRSPQAKNTGIYRNRFIRNNVAHKLGPSEIFIWGRTTDPNVLVASGEVADNVYSLVDGVCFFTNVSERTRANWKLRNNVQHQNVAELKRIMPYNDPPEIKAVKEVWTDAETAILTAAVNDDGRSGKPLKISWEQIEGPAVAEITERGTFAKVTLPMKGDYRFLVTADDGQLWRTSRTAIHALAKGTKTLKSWDFATNHDSEGWAFDGLGTTKESFIDSKSMWSSFSLPVHLVCGDYYVLAIKDATNATLTSSAALNVRLAEGAEIAIKLMNRTTSKAMRVYWQLVGETDFSHSVVVPMVVNDTEDQVYRAPLLASGNLNRLKLAFSADGSAIVGTARIDYIQIGCKNGK